MAEVHGKPEGNAVNAVGEGKGRDSEHLVAVWESSLAAQDIEMTTPGLIAALSSPRLDIRTGAAILLGRRGEACVVSHLKSLLTDEISVVRVEVAMSLELLGDGSGIPALVEILREGLFTSAPVTAARYLADLGDPRGYKTVLKALSSELVGIRLGAAVALKSFLSYHGRVLDDQKVDLLAVLEESLGDPDPLVRRELLHKVALLDDAGASALISRIADSDTDERVRQLAQELQRPRSGAPHSQDPEEKRCGQATSR